MSLADRFADVLAGGKRRRLKRAIAHLRAVFEPETLDQATLERAAATYRRTLHLAIRIDPSQAQPLYCSYDGRIPADCYTRAFQSTDQAWLSGLARKDDAGILTVVLEVAGRLGFDRPQLEAAERLSSILARNRDSNRLVQHLLRCQQLELLNADTLHRALHTHVTRSPLERESSLWSSFFAGLPEASLPPLYEVHRFLGRGVDVVKLADNSTRQQEALKCCIESPRLADVEAGLELARHIENVDAIRRLQKRAGDLLFSLEKYAEAIDRYRDADCAARLSECHERLGQFFEALATCPSEQANRLAALAELCQPVVDASVERQDYVEAARQVHGLVTNLDRVTEVTETVTTRRAEVTSLREGVLAAGRQHFSALAQQAASTDRSKVYETWSQFEEEGGDLARAAQRAEDAGDCYRAHRLFRQAGLFGEAVRILKVDTTPEGLASRAEASADGGDPAGAARLYEQAGQLENAARFFEEAGEPASAARCLREHLGDEAIESPEFAAYLRKAGLFEELVSLCTTAIQRKGRGTRAVDQLRFLVDNEGSSLPPDLLATARTTLEFLGAQGRREFEEHVQAWVAKARIEVDQRFAAIWGLDLGTTTCSVAIYDCVNRQPVICPWKGRDQFASTLSLDEQGNELVGLAGEEIFAHGLVGHINASKRKIGTHSVYRIREHSYRPEEVAARLISHARSIVEGFLDAQVRERVRELACTELGDVPDDWLHWAGQHHDLRLPRPRVIVTIPAYFHNNQKHATRDACQIAGVELVRLIHEPTAACMAVGHTRQINGRVVVVDLGAGTLDVSFLNVDSGVYEVQQVLGNNQYGGHDFDANISKALVKRLQQTQGIEVPSKGLANRRLVVAAEYLKIALSTQQHSDFFLRSFVADKDVRLELSQTELEKILEEPLRTLHQTCTEFKTSLVDQPQHLVLVGGPMLSPLVSRQVESVFKMKRIGVVDPRTAVACGAALQGAVLDKKLEDTLLIDVVPLPLGIRIFDKEDREQFSVLVAKNTTIPTEKKEIYSTHDDNQPAVNVEIFQGQLDARSKIGHFRLDGIRPAKKGEPQIEVTFSIDASCVLEVTARDKQTGLSNSVTLTDTTLLSPGERDAMARRFGEQREREEQRQQLRDALESLRQQASDADGGSSEAIVREWRSRLAAYRPSPIPLDAETQQTLFEMFNNANELESELLLTEVPLSDVVAKTTKFLEYAEKLCEGEPSAQDVAGALTQAHHLAGEIAKGQSRLQPLRSRLVAWNRVLVNLATAETDPLRRFLALHDAGDYARALEALSDLPTPPDYPPHILKQLDCLAKVGDAAGYRHQLSTHAEQLQIIPFYPEEPDSFLGHVQSALAEVRITKEHGRVAVGRGFLLSDELLATNQRWLVEEGAGQRRTVATERVEVHLDNVLRRVEHIFLPPSAQGDVALLRLTESVDATPFRLGHVSLVRIGDPVWTPATGSDSSDGLLSGLVNKFESFPEWKIRLIKLGMRASAEYSGGPLLNDLGEVVGVLTIKARHGQPSGEETCFAQMVDSLEPLLAVAGFNTGPA